MLKKRDLRSESKTRNFTQSRN